MSDEKTGTETTQALEGMSDALLAEKSGQCDALLAKLVPAFCTAREIGTVQRGNITSIAQIQALGAIVAHATPTYKNGTSVIEDGGMQRLKSSLAHFLTLLFGDGQKDGLAHLGKGLSFTDNSCGGVEWSRTYCDIINSAEHTIVTTNVMMCRIAGEQLKRVKRIELRPMVEAVMHFMNDCVPNNGEPFVVDDFFRIGGLDLSKYDSRMAAPKASTTSSSQPPATKPTSTHTAPPGRPMPTDGRTQPNNRTQIYNEVVQMRLTPKNVTRLLNLEPRLTLLELESILRRVCQRGDQFTNRQPYPEEDRLEIMALCRASYISHGMAESKGRANLADLERAADGWLQRFISPEEAMRGPSPRPAPRQNTSSTGTLLDAKGGEVLTQLATTSTRAVPAAAPSAPALTPPKAPAILNLKQPPPPPPPPAPAQTPKVEPETRTEPEATIKAEAEPKTTPTDSQNTEPPKGRRNSKKVDAKPKDEAAAQTKAPTRTNAKKDRKALIEAEEARRRAAADTQAADAAV